ncbi:sigma-54 interaction domain-containing protein [Halalkalibacter akibai]|uniref:Arginine utilization regulatory protein RocR n=1 Tax=Halalkalibacter akibai (strain ATCC 43226 / DSM 21942 / CIP 109018 / JCM 9157 / 1139) TaxID=1236973 RepID=W4R028_HALA3|nr:sigma-54-dependent Fis family transcriptional regulator [Halalkalibacter akibai]GAE37696.1 arginine utilization regulatory protein RocR [Halalkalibacter akibai JCM 9157]
MNSEKLQQLKTLQAIYEQVIDHIDVGIQVIDSDGKTIIYNKKKMDLESMDLEDVLNKSIHDVFRFEQEQDSRLLQALESGKEIKNAKQTYYNKDGKKITTINHTFPIVSNGERIGAVELANDISKYERLKENVLKNDHTRYTFENIVGNSASLSEVINNAKRASRTSSSILIIGETGTGKEIFAQSIHNASERAQGPFISQNCAAIPDSLIESLLFGTKKGAFTGAIEKPGLFEQAEGGTLLLDEINSLNPALQAKLLRALQERTIRRVGDTRDKKINVRIIATINEDPIEAIAANSLRKDLYYRLSVVALFIPPLRERTEDIPLLTNFFINKYNRMFQMNIKAVDLGVEEAFKQYQWPGNVRELEHIIEGSMNLVNDDMTMIRYTDLPFHFLNKQDHQSVSTQLNMQTLSNNSVFTNTDKSLKHWLHEVEIAYIENMLIQYNYNISKTAEKLGISRQSLQYRLRKNKRKSH